MKYLAILREDLTTQVEERALRNKTTITICKFLLENITRRYGCAGKANRET